MLPRLLLLGLIAFSFVGADYNTPKQADKEFLLKQKKVYNLLYHINQPDFVNKALYEEGQAWNIEANINSYSNMNAVKEFLYMYRNGMLGRGEIFSLYYPNLLKELKSLFRLFYYASDFDTFFKTAAWARNNMNEAEYFFALYSAVLMRPDTKFIQLPPPYEIYPYLFFNSDVMQKAKYPELFGQPVSDPQTPAMYTSYIFPANYSGWYLNREYDMENKLNYFTEDIGLNTFYFFFRLGLPFWLESKEFDMAMSSRGAEYLYGHKLLLDRYYLERLSNDLPRMEDFNWYEKFYPGYYPTMSFHNGLPLPQRACWSDIPSYKYKYVKDIVEKESRISAVIDYGYISKSANDSKWKNIYAEDGLNIIGNLIEGNADSYVPDYYGSIDSLGRKILGFNLEPTSKYQIYPSALETYFASMRDPAFYRLYERILSYYYRYKERETPYRMDEIVYPNLKIESFAIDKLSTYFDKFDTSISNGLLIDKMKENEKMPLIKVRQYRLNHKPFNFHITVNSDKPMKATIRIFLGPKYDAHRKLPYFPDNLKYFYQMDNWIVDLNAGLNKIVRNSRDSYFTIPDQEPSEIFYNNIEMSLSEGKPFTYYERVYGFPQRLLLPKGKKEGMPFQFFIYISPVTTEVRYSSRLWGELRLDDRPFGFPLDKLMYDYNYDGPNMIFKDVLIYHKDEFDMNMAY